ncbi:hypothetical protein XA68_14042 [Ophiocordyceps unilateralis]|uniref:2EXR domain-containing protein n=1 Tax=Ophiocordyceps unilateralis TaxID=268505 RepID=A0A2A9P9J0_OPHUN|nr:hypothetical protein XA68_14042 [Ophiocordyceps unilateralis]
MDGRFTLFPKLPPELRREIWRFALDKNLTVTGFRRGKDDEEKPIYAVGQLPSDVGQSCYEARVVMRASHVLVEGLGWIHFARHIFLYHGLLEDERLIDDVDECYHLFSRIQHLILDINPHRCDQLFNFIDTLRGSGVQLRSLIFVSPPIDPYHVSTRGPLTVEEWAQMKPVDIWPQPLSPELESPRLLSRKYWLQVDETDVLASPASGRHFRSFFRVFFQVLLYATNVLSQKDSTVFDPKPAFYLCSRDGLRARWEMRKHEEQGKGEQR